jgi:serine protease Do
MAVAERAFSEATVAEELSVTAGVVQRSTVHVRSHGRGAGSGVIWRPDGLIITNAHVAHGPSATVELSDGRTFEALVTARDPQRDLAALTVQATDLPAATIVDSDTLRVGQLVAAVGNPLGLTGALTLGIIHAIAPAEGHGSRTWVQADVRLAPGNSGGPLVDVQGRVIGINSMIAGGLGLAVPSNAVLDFLGSRDSSPRLGIILQPVAIHIEQQRRAGLLVMEVAAESAAERAGLIVGDILIGVGGRPIQSPNDLFSVLRRTTGGVSVHLDVLRGGVPFARDVVLFGVDGSIEGSGAAA